MKYIYLQNETIKSEPFSLIYSTSLSVIINKKYDVLLLTFNDKFCGCEFKNVSKSLILACTTMSTTPVSHCFLSEHF